jgi:8-amino-7-oxononanoate synthase
MSLAWIARELKQFEVQSLRRHLIIRGSQHGARIVVDGRAYLNFGSNDYLGLAADPRLAEAASHAATKLGWGSGASPLVVGRSSLHAELERRLAAFEGSEAALTFVSGYAANAGTIPALTCAADVIFSDARNHASIIDGCRLSRATTVVYQHNDLVDLRSKIASTCVRTGPRPHKNDTTAGRRLIVTDTLFSMDGDVAPLAELYAIAEEFDAMLLLDEAHATGVFGPRGRGLAELAGVEDPARLIRVGTLSKALGSIGGFVAGSRELIDWLSNRARSYVYSTAPPAASAAAALAALNIVRDEPARRSNLLANATRVREALNAQGWRTGASSSQIIPLIVGDPQDALSLSEQLREQGLFIPAIRPPSVPTGQALLRLSLSAAHDEPMLDRLLEVLARLV